MKNQMGRDQKFTRMHQRETYGKVNLISCSWEERPKHRAAGFVQAPEATFRITKLHPGGCLDAAGFK